MEELNQQQIQGQQANFQGNQEKGHINGSQTNIKVFSKTDIFNHLNTEMSEIHDNDIYPQDLVGKLMGEEKVNASQIHQIVQQAIYPYIEKIRQLEEIQQQKDNQITALFYTVKKMDEIIKKIETEQSKSSLTKTTTTGRKATTIISQTASGAAGSTRSSSTARSSQINSSTLSQSTVLPSQTDRVLTKKPSVPSLLDSKKSGQSMSKSTLHEPIGSKGEKESTRTSKVNTPASKTAKDGKEVKDSKEASEPIKKVLKSKLGNSEGDQKEKSSSTTEQKQRKSITNNSTNQNTNEAQSNNNTQEQKADVNANNYNTAPPLFLHDLNDDSHLIDNKNYGSDKEDHHKNILNNSNNINEDSMLI